MIDKEKIIKYLNENYITYKKIQYKSSFDSFNAGIGYGVSKFIELMIIDINQKNFDKK